ncbi:hypothetical protein D3C86_1156340 [compost metagenome]
MGRADLGFRREQVRRTHLYRRSAEHEGGGDASGVSDAASGNHRHFHRIDDLGHQGESPHLTAQVIAEKHPAMAPGLVAHGNDCIAAMLLKPHRFCDGGGRRQYLRTGGLDPVEQGFFRQAKVKTHHFRAKRFDHFAGRIIERRPVGHRRRRIEVDTELLVVGLQQVFPVLCALLVRGWRLMAEEVDVDRALGVLADGFQLFAQLIRAEHCRWHRAQPAGIAGGNHHGRVGGTGHRPLNDRQFDPEQVKNAGIWPLVHVLCSPTLDPGRDGRAGFVTQRLAQGQSSFQRGRFSSASVEGVIHKPGRVVKTVEAIIAEGAGIVLAVGFLSFGSLWPVSRSTWRPDWLKVEYGDPLPCAISIALPPSD